MCQDFGGAIHMRGRIYEIFGWWITETLEYTARYELAPRRIIKRSSCVHMIIGIVSAHTQ